MATSSEVTLTPDHDHNSNQRINQNYAIRGQEVNTMSMERNPMTNSKQNRFAIRNLRNAIRKCSIVGLIATSTIATGCSSITQPLSGIPARRLPPQFFTPTKSNLVPLEPSRLAQEPPRNYLLDSGDILGIYIEGILPYTTQDKIAEPPPVNFPTAESTLDPSLGYPVAIQEDGSIALPSLEPLKVRGLTIEQSREVIRRAYLDAKVFNDPTRLRPIVTLIKERTYNIVVVRQDIGGEGSRGAQANQLSQKSYIRGADQSAAGSLIKLPAYQNDVLHALMASGGLPGLNAKNEVKILRASKADQRRRDAFIAQYYQQIGCNQDPCSCPPPIPDDPSIIKIPLRLAPGVIPSFRNEDILLQEGDVISIESRAAEVFYTGGLLPGGEWPIPRDYDLDVLGAMGVAGQGFSSPSRAGGGGGGGGGGLGVGSIGGVPPGRIYILRKTPCNGQVTIEVDLARAAQDPRERPLVQPGDTLILRYKPGEELLNFGLGTFFTYGIQSILRRN